ncbi:hypothetical protein LAZ67_18001853 [Cordylochernes scorpioides]|uniref:RNA-directed DNA polymerase n=1 Tax=Cordylochernes scorpioides TaxID=51811 RepID=A0ABY6LIQ8_9ARAC|nr:hypothetical protein LAZ67_18001853 [Cordylochernes scorpioides]
MLSPIVENADNGRRDPRDIHQAPKNLKWITTKPIRSQIYRRQSLYPNRGRRPQDASPFPQAVIQANTGAAITTLTKCVYFKYFENIELNKCDTILTGYSGSKIPILGKAKFEIKYRNVSRVIDIPVTDLNFSKFLLGRDFLIYFDISFNYSHTLNSFNVESLINDYKFIFEYKSGPIKGIKCHHDVKADFIPKFYKFRQVPFASKQLVEDNIDKLVDLNILSPIDRSDCASPLVCIAKPDGQIRLCAYLKKSLNPYLEDVKYPTPNIDSVTRLLNWFKESENARIKRLITGVELGNMKPSQLLQKLRAIATPDISEKLIRILWLDNLPDSFKAILLAAKKIRSSDNSTAGYNEPCRKYRLFVFDKISKLKFLVDTGADMSIIPATAQSKQESDYKLYAANGFEIKYFGVKILNLDLGLRRDFQWLFMIANVKRGILGDDFLFKYNLLVDINKRKLIDGHTNLEIICEAISTFEDEDQEMTAIITPFGLFEFNVRCFGLRNAPATFQRFMHEVLRDLNFAFSYLDDILIASTDGKTTQKTPKFDEQILDSELNNLQTNVQTSLKFKQYPLPSGKMLWCDTSTANIRPYLPKYNRMRMFNQIHGLSHLGIRSTIKQMTQRFIWPSIRKDVLQWSRDCRACQRNKINRHTKTSFGTFKISTEKFNDIHIDLVGPLPPSNNYIYCLTCIDRYSNWMEAIPLENNSSDTVARAIYNNWITRYGTPLRLVPDRGAQFTSDTFANLTKICGIKLQNPTAYHPQANGKVERLHRTLKAAIRAHNNPTWSESIPTILLGLRTAIPNDSDHSIAQVVYGNNIRLPGELFVEPDSYLTQEETDRVKKASEPPYEGPFQVLRREKKYFIIKIKNKEVSVSIDRLKPAYLLNTSQPEESAKDNTSIRQPVEPPADIRRTSTRTGRTIKPPVRFQDYQT